MKQRKEEGEIPQQINLDFRTDADLVKSIRQKRERGIPLDEREGEFLDQQRKEDRKDLKDLYPH